MYERNAIVIERYFSKLFGYGQDENLKKNYFNFCELVNKLAEYERICGIEDAMMIEYEKIANEIKETQKTHQILDKRDAKLKETRNDLIENIEEDAEVLRKKLYKIDEELNKNNINMQENVEEFLMKIADFHQKSDDRNKCGRERRIIESEYQKILQNTVKNISKLDENSVKNVKIFLRQEDFAEIKEDIENEISKNGEKEKVPFDMEAISKAVEATIELEEIRAEILIFVYERCLKLLAEIKNDAVKIEKYKKVVKDCQAKQEYINAVNEYIILFLDNERMNVIGGEKEHSKLMKKACENIENDTKQIKNMYEIVEKEVLGKATKKIYKELYSPEYLHELLEDEKEFEKNISKINVIGTVIYPDYWRIEGMQKIFEAFKDIASNVYEKDLSEYEPIDLVTERNSVEEIVEDDFANDNIDDFDIDDFNIESNFDDEYQNDEENDEKEGKVVDKFFDEEWDEEDDENEEDDDGDEDVEEYYEEELDEIIDDNEEDDEEKRDREIDEILGFYNTDSTENLNDEYDGIDFDEEIEENGKKIDEIIDEEFQANDEKETDNEEDMKIKKTKAKSKEKEKEKEKIKSKSKSGKHSKGVPKRMKK